MQNFLLLRAHVFQSANKSTSLPASLSRILKKKEQFQIDTHRSLSLCQRKPAFRSPQAKRGSAMTINGP